MNEKYFYIDEAIARELIAQTKNMKPAKKGAENRVYLFNNYAVLKSCRLKTRNVAVKDYDFAHLDKIIITLKELYDSGINVVPILGYCFPYVIQTRAKGTELSNINIATIPHHHIEKLKQDAIAINNKNILIDCASKDNFFYDEKIGIQFIDMNAHADYYYHINNAKVVKGEVLSTVRPSDEAVLTKIENMLNNTKDGA
jgi:hypothetical protein